MEKGWIKIYRKIVDWEWYKDIPVRVLFEHCFLKANIKDKKWQGTVIKRGSFITSLDNLVFETGLSKMQVRTALNKLKTTHEITYQATRQYSIITVNNYELYQPDNTQDNTPITHKQHTDNTPITLTKEYKNIKNERSIFLLDDKKTDPYINPIKTFFISEYNRIFGNKPFISNQDCHRLIEIAADHEDIRELIPVALERLKEIRFEDIQFTPTASWLLKGNNFERVMNGEFEPKKSAAELYRERRKQCESS